MRNIIHSLRRKPEGVRIKMLFVLIIGSLVLLLAFWIFSFSSNLSDSNAGVKTKESLNSLSNFKDSVVDSYNNTFKPALDNQ